MAFWPTGDAYAIDDDDDSSDTILSSSEDEINVILHGTPEQKRKLRRLQNKEIANRLDERNKRHQSSSSEDEFEKEVNAELAQHVSFLEKNRAQPACRTRQENPPHTSEMMDQGDGPKEKAYYDDIYFDSDEEADDEGDQPQGSGKHAVISDDDLLYDPTMDDKDQKWVDKQRRRNNNTIFEGLMPQLQKKSRKPSKLPTSDALLDCPACLTTLCIDCQRHETYKHQYRAMFVMNCEVDNSQMLQCPEMQTKGKRKKKKTSQSEAPESSANPDTIASSDLFHPVKCTECTTIVGVIDSDEVYHFFNILASHT